MSIKPGGDRFGLVASREVVEFGRLAFRGLLRGVEQMLPMFRFQSFAELAKEGLHVVRGLLQMRGGPTRRRGRIVQFVRQSRRHCAEGNELLPLLRVTLEVSHAT